MHTYLNLSSDPKIQPMPIPQQSDKSPAQTQVTIIGSRYRVAFPTDIQAHLVDKQRRCSCALGLVCPAVKAVAEYLMNGGQRAPDPAQCPICDAATVPDHAWDGKFTREPGWRCVKGGLTHFLQAKARRIQNRRQLSAASDPEPIAGR